MNHLRRERAPLSAQAFELIEDEARDVLKTYLAARKFVDFDGPHGWQHNAVNPGHARAFTTPAADAGVEARLRTSLPLMEIRVPFELPMQEIDDIDRGATDPDLGPVNEAARKLARTEDRMVFYGAQAAQIQGIVSGSPHPPIPLSNNFEHFPAQVSQAIASLHDAGVGGPYALLLDAQAYAALSRATAEGGGYPVLQHVRRLVEGPTILATAIDGALLISMRGGDFQLVVGQDISVGYLAHDRDRVQLYLEESFTFRLLGAEAALSLPMQR